MRYKLKKHLNKILFTICICFLSLHVTDVRANKPNDEWVMSAADQINFLIEYNEKKVEESKPSEQWFIYFLGADAKELEHILDQTESLDDTYLSNMNSKIASINSTSDLLMYVAFTVYDIELITPLFPDKDCNTLNCQKNYAKSFFDGWGEQKKAEDFTLFTENFKTTMQGLYESTGLLEASQNKNKKVLLPFSMRTTRKIYSKTGIEGLVAKTYDSYTLYFPNKKDSFNAEELKRNYNEMTSLWGTTSVEKKMERVVRAIEKYDGNLPCSQLLYSKKYKDLVENLGPNDTWVIAIQSNPCILNQMVPAGDWWGFKTQFDQDMMIFVGAFLYPALAIPAGALIGEVALAKVIEYLIKRYGAKKVKDVIQAAATNIILQTAMQYYFGPDSVTGENDITTRWYLAAKEIDSGDLAKDVVVAALDLNLKADLILACLNKGVEIDLENIEDISFNAQACTEEIATMIVTKLIFDTVSGVGKKILEVFRNNPQKFIYGLREILVDSGKGGREAFSESYEDLVDAFDINNSSLLDSKVKAEFEYGIQVDDYTNEQLVPGNQKFDFSNTIKDVASEIEFNMANNASEVSKLGANITLEFEGLTGIKPTLLAELEDEAYKMIFVLDKNVTINSITDFLPHASDSRKQVLNALKEGIRPKVLMKGGNATKYFGKTNIEIDLKEIEVYTLNAEGNLTSKKLDLSNSEVLLTKILDKVKNLPNAQAFVNRLNEVDDFDLLQRIDNLSENQLQKLNEFYDSSRFQLPGNRPNGASGDFTVKTRNDKYDVYFDKNGFVDFENPIFGPGKEFSFVSDDLTGDITDFSKATKWLKEKFENSSNIKIKSNSTNVDITIDGNTKTYTWHHHQDGKTLMMIVSDAHNQVAHTGGASIIARFLKGLFASPN